MNGKWVFGLVSEYIGTRRRNVDRPRERWRGEYTWKLNKIENADGDRNILRESLPDQLLFTELRECHSYKSSYGTDCRKFERGHILAFVKEFHDCNSEIIKLFKC
jgi:hypothetical protein